MRLSFDSSISTLSATVDARHPLTAGHSERVTEYTLLIARDMGLPESDIEVLKYAALLHDIGKIGIRDSVLLKNGKFTDEDREEMNAHPVKTRDILEKFHFPRGIEGRTRNRGHHHEKINGQGYPDGLTGDKLPLGSKILAVADVFDALTSRRDYPKYTADRTLTRAPMALELAVNILREGSGTHFEPQIVKTFLRVLPRVLRLYRGAHFPPAYCDPWINKSTDCD